MLAETLDLGQPVYVVATIFRLAEHVARMRALHPDWSDRQCACCLYWQGGARKVLRQKVRKWMLASDPAIPWMVVWCPEAQGVNVTATMRAVGVELEWPPVKLAYQIVLIGVSHATRLDC